MQIRSIGHGCNGSRSVPTRDTGSLNFYLLHRFRVHHVECVPLTREPEPAVHRLLVVLQPAVVDEGAVAGVARIAHFLVHGANMLAQVALHLGRVVAARAWIHNLAVLGPAVNLEQCCR